jgi:hypothetical protein
MGFFVNRIGLTSGQALVAKTTMPAATTGRAVVQRGRGVQPATPPRGLQPSNEAQYVDPLTNEPFDDDFTFTLKLDVVLEDFGPYMPEEPVEGDATDDQPPATS